MNSSLVQSVSLSGCSATGQREKNANIETCVLFTFNIFMSLDAFFKTHTIHLEAWTSPLIRGPPDTPLAPRNTTADCQLCRYGDRLWLTGMRTWSNLTEPSDLQSGPKPLVCVRGGLRVCVRATGLYHPQWIGKLMNAKFGDCWEGVETWTQWEKMLRIKPRMPQILIVRLRDSRCGPPG